MEVLLVVGGFVCFLVGFSLLVSLFLRDRDWTLNRKGRKGGREEERERGRAGSQVLE